MPNEPRPLAYITALDDQGAALHTAVRPPRFTIGRAPDNDLCLAHDFSVSRHHCVLETADAQLTLHDLGSANGTCVNGRRITDRDAVTVPAWLLVGQTSLGIVPGEAAQPSFRPGQSSAAGMPSSVLIPPSTAFVRRTEAFVVVDVIGSSSLLQGCESQYYKVIAVLGQLLDRGLRGQGETFLKCTGDGFFACVPQADAALRLALELPDRLAHHFRPPPRLSIALHWGGAQVTFGGDRTGVDVHGVFALEDLRRHDSALREWVAPHDRAALIVMTRSFWELLPAPLQADARTLGERPLKGLPRAEQVYQWLGAF